MNEPETIRSILQNVRTIAVIGLSGKPERASFGVSRYLQRQGYRIVPVNPMLSEVLGETAYPTVQAAAAAVGKIDLVLVFRAPRYVPEIVASVIRLKVEYLWLQLGVIDQDAAERAEEAGVKVVMDRCIFQEHMAYRADLLAQESPDSQERPAPRAPVRG